MKKNYFLLFVLLLPVYSYSQQIVKIKNVAGEYVLSPKSDVSLKSAFEKATNDAKLNALRKAGVAENISSSDLLTTDQNETYFKQDVKSILAIELNGAVLNDSTISESSSVDQFGNTVVKVTLDVDVIKYTKTSDPSFDFKLEGIKEYYENDDIMKFTFLPYSSGYLKIFDVNDAENYCVYPYEDKHNQQLNDIKNNLFKANQLVQFPVNKLMGNPKTKENGYMLNTELAKEKNFLIFVYTKDDIPFTEKYTYKNILSWIYKITPDKRKVQFFDFEIVNKEAAEGNK
jgi:hypothetical protein